MGGIDFEILQAFLKEGRGVPSETNMHQPGDPTCTYDTNPTIKFFALCYRAKVLHLFSDVANNVVSTLA